MMEAIARQYADYIILIFFFVVYGGLFLSVMFATWNAWEKKRAARMRWHRRCAEHFMIERGPKLVVLTKTSCELCERDK